MTKSRILQLGLPALALVGSLVAVLLVIRSEPADGPTGEPAPTQDFALFDGSSASLTEYQGRPLVVNFWASWCPPCVAEMPYFEAAYQRLGEKVAFLGINTQDEPSAAAELADQTGVSYDLAADPDGELFEAFGVFGMPSTFFISSEGFILDRHTGLLTAELLDQRIDELFGL